MNDTLTDRHESWALANLLTGRYGSLALSRAAGEAAAAARKGDMEQSAIWHGVVALLRHTIGMGGHCEA